MEGKVGELRARLEGEGQGWRVQGKVGRWRVEVGGWRVKGKVGG